MYKKSVISQAVILALLGAGTASAEPNWEVSGYLKNESSVFTSSGQVIGEKLTRTDSTTGHSAGDGLKSEFTANLFVNADFSNDSSLHAQIKAIYDAEGSPHEYQGYQSYSQHDWLRELYVDSSSAGIDWRIGKQQVVWGTADGIKLLDIINPTDYREFTQNSMEESRIPVWMINGEKQFDNGGNFQLIVAQAKSNKIPGLDSDGDYGHSFVMKGVDSITGRSNGFLNIGTAMGKVSAFFRTSAGAGTANLFNNYQGATVQEFTSNATDVNDFKGLCGGTSTANCLYTLANATGTAVNGVVRGGNQDVTNLIDSDSATSPNANWDSNNPNSVFEYMKDASFATFYSFTNMSTTYRVDKPDDFDSNLGLRYRDTTAGGTNWSVNYLYAFDPNPYIELSWEDQAGNALQTVYTTGNSVGFGAATGAAPTTVLLSTNGTVAGLINPDSTQRANLVFTEKHNRIHNLGASFDSTVESESLGPVVLRGEFLYQKDVMTPVVDRAKLRIGDLAGALKNQESDYFKYVLGADITVMSNMLVSGQFIQFRNLDFVEENSTVGSITDQKYTADGATLSLTNGLQKARENKEFISIFLTKPFGPSQRGRWGDILLAEEGGGYWNRFNVEYEFTDEFIGTAELNSYWGDQETMFGQFKESSNIQLGIQYIF